MDREALRKRRKHCTARPWGQGRHAFSKIRIAVGMEIAAEDSNKANILTVRMRLKTVSQRRGVDKTKSF